MAIEAPGAALRQIDRHYADGTVTGLSDTQLPYRFAGRFVVVRALLARGKKFNDPTTG